MLQMNPDRFHGLRYIRFGIEKQGLMPATCSSLVFAPFSAAHQAVGVIREALNDDCCYVLDADLEQ